MISNIITRVLYQGDGQTTEFPFPFKILKKSDIKVVISDEKVERLLTSDYFVDMDEKVLVYPGYAPGEEPAEGERPEKLPVGYSLAIYRETPITQDSTYGKKWPFDEIEDSMDKAAMIEQELKDKLSRSIRLKETTPDTKLELPNVCSGAAIGWSSDGKSMVNIPVTMMNEESQRAAKIAVDAKEEALSHKEEASAHMNKSFEYMMAAEKSESNAKEWAEFAKSQARAKDGAQGEKGDPGPKGEKGDRGEQGPQGIQGERGVKGDQGIRGEKGEQGEPGSQGKQGIPGERGERGVPGPKGEKGNRGEQGPQGIQGERGEKGDQGIRGEKGERGEPGIQGKQGMQGERGERGVPGPKGEKGDTPSLDGYAKISDVERDFLKKTDTPKIDLTGYYNKVETDSKFQTKGNYVTEENANKELKKSEYFAGVRLLSELYNTSINFPYCIPDGIKEINKEIVQKYKLTQKEILIFPATVKTIWDNQHANPEFLESESIFERSQNLSIVFSIATNIGAGAFWRCSSLTTINLPQATNIGESAFYDCRSLTTIDLPQATNIGERAFQGCSSLTTIIISEKYKFFEINKKGHKERFDRFINDLKPTCIIYNETKLKKLNRKTRQWDPI